MAHEIETTDRMVYAGTAPWHIGETADRSKALPEDCQRDPLRAVEYAGVGYKVEAMPLMAHVKRPPVEGATDEVVIVTPVTHRANVRMDSGAVLGVVGADYEIVQNTAVAEWFRPFCDAGATIETLGTLRHGSRFWCLAKLPCSGAVTTAPGDTLDAYLLLSHAHDGSLSVRIGRTDVRVVCANTLRAAHDAGTSRLVKFKHTSGVSMAMAQAQRIVDKETGEFKATLEQYRFLAEAKIADPADLKAYVRIVCDVPTEAELPSEKLSGRTRNKLERIEQLTWHGAGNTAPEVRGSWYAALNGASDYFTHEAGHNEETRVSSLWFGENARSLARAVDEAMARATVKA